jgi:hypothetical protein
LTSYIKNQKAQPANIRTQGSNTKSIQAGVPNNPAQSGNSTGRGFDPIGLLRNWVFGTGGQENRNQGNTYNNRPVEQKNQKYVTSGYSGKTQALGGTDQELDTKELRPNGIYNPYQIGQKKGVNANPTANIGQANFNAQKNTNAHPLSTTDNPYTISQEQTGATGGFNGNISTEGNTNVGLNAIRVPNLSGYNSGTQPLVETTNTINQTQNKFSTDLPMQRQEFSKASKSVGWQVANKIHAAIPPTDPRWNMKQNLYQKAMQAEDPLIEIQNNPQLKPSQQFMQQKGSNITPLLNYDAFNSNYQGNEMQNVKESVFIPFIVLAAGIGAYIVLRRK